MMELLLACVATYKDQLPRPVTQVEYQTFATGAPRPWGKFVEDLSSVLTINEMLLQSYTGTLRLFPAWPRDQDASFRGLRAVGAFLVSAALAGGEVREVRILSERGEPCRVLNPWPGAAAKCTCDGQGVPMEVEGEALRFRTSPGKTYVLAK
jgi:hypothetical protein